MYFEALARSRGSLSRLPALALVVGFLLLVCNVGPLNAPDHYQGYETLSYLSGTNVALIWICVIVFVLAMFKRLTHRYQVISSAAMTGMAFMLVYALCSLTIPVATLIQARGERIYAILFNAVGFLAVVLVLVATAVHVLFFRRRLVDGHSEKRMLGNLIAASRSNRSKSLCIAFGVALVVPNVLTQGQFVVNVLGAAALLFLAVLTPGLPVEFAYLTCLKARDKRYWERPSGSAGRRQSRPK